MKIIKRHASEEYVEQIQMQLMDDVFNGTTGTVEITDSLPSKTGTVLTVNPNADEINLYTSNEVDDMIDILVTEKADKTEIPTTLPASDVYDWAKQPTKPTYTADEIGAATQEDFEEALNNLSGTVEVTGDDPEKTGTVLTINPNGNTINVYTVEEIDDLISQLQREIEALKTQ